MVQYCAWREKPLRGNRIRAISSAGRAPGSQSGGHGFDPHMVHTQRTPRQGVSFVYDPLRGSPMKESRSDSLATSLRRLHMPVYHSEVVGHDPLLYFSVSSLVRRFKNVLSSWRTVQRREAGFYSVAPRCLTITLHERATRGLRSPHGHSDYLHCDRPLFQRMRGFDPSRSEGFCQTFRVSRKVVRATHRFDSLLHNYGRLITRKYKIYLLLFQSDMNEILHPACSCEQAGALLRII